MSGSVFVLNAGSSSLKYQLVDPDTAEVHVAGTVERIGEEGSDVPDHEAAVRRALDAIEGRPDPVACGHRVVHGGERFDSATALRIGLVHEVADDLDGAVEAVVGELLSAGPQAARWAKGLVRERPDGPETARWIAERRTSEEGQEGLRAFLEKRPASWRG